MPTPLFWCLSSCLSTMSNILLDALDKCTQNKLRVLAVFWPGTFRAAVSKACFAACTRDSSWSLDMPELQACLVELQERLEERVALFWQSYLSKCPPSSLASREGACWHWDDYWFFTWFVQQHHQQWAEATAACSFAINLQLWQRKQQSACNLCVASPLVDCRVDLCACGERLAIWRAFLLAGHGAEGAKTPHFHGSCGWLPHGWGASAYGGCCYLVYSGSFDWPLSF